MNLHEPPVDSECFGRGDDLDEMLRAYLGSQVPRSWVPPRVPAAAPPSRPLPGAWPRRWFPRSRLALAASVGLLLAGPLLLADRLAVTRPPSPAGEVGRSATRDRSAADLMREGPVVPEPGRRPAGDGPADGDKDAYEFLDSLIHGSDGRTYRGVTVIPRN